MQDPSPKVQVQRRRGKHSCSFHLVWQRLCSLETQVWCSVWLSPLGRSSGVMMLGRTEELAQAATHVQSTHLFDTKASVCDGASLKA